VILKDTSKTIYLRLILQIGNPLPSFSWAMACASSELDSSSSLNPHWSAVQK